MPIQIRKANREEVLASMPLREFFVFWDDISANEIALLQNILEKDTDEREMQNFLQEYPRLLIQHLGGGHGRWVIPQKKLGAEYVTDFVIGEAHSGGHDWQAVELESPKASLFTKKGDPSATLAHAIRQIQDWRSWISYNQNYASRPKTENGLGLTDISCNVKGLILIGRRAKVDPSTKVLRRRISEENNIMIHTYDCLLDNAIQRLSHLSRGR